jgi:ABC-type Fe3+-hydroxamate transport system substrate-binding protein
MSFSSKKFRDFEELQVYLNGGVICGVNVSQPVYGLVGKTLTFTRPAFSVTFAAVAGRLDGSLFAPEIKAQVEAADASTEVAVHVRGTSLYFIEKDPKYGVALSPSATETARTALGLPITGACEGRVIKQVLSPTPPRVENILQASDGTYYLLIWEGN